MGRSIFASVLLVMLFVCGANAAEVKNTLMRQEGNRAVFEYNIEGKEAEADVTLTLTIGGKIYTQKDLHLEGDIGKVKTGKGKKIYWNVLQDFPKGVHGDIDFELTAGGGVEELKSRKVKIDNGDGTVTDYATGLTWQQRDDGKQRTWQDAIDYCERLSLGGHSDWRLPNKDELASLVDKNRRNLTIDTTLFPDTKESYYWSSTTFARNTSNAGGVDFDNGYVIDFLDKTARFYVRCVR